MYKAVKVLVGLGVMLALSSLGVEAAKKGSTGAQVLKVGVGARAISMGEAGVAVENGPATIYWNPAVLTEVDQRQMSFMHTQWLQGVNYESVGYVQPMAQEGALGISISYLNSGSMEKWNAGGTKEGEFKAADTVISFAYGWKYSEGLALGGSIKAVLQEIDNENASSIALDAGFLCQTPVPNLVIGASIQNAGSEPKFVNQGDKLPLNLKLGGACQGLEGKLLLAVDLNKPADNDLRLNLGAEYWLTSGLALRGGCNSGADEGPGITAGVGFKVRGLQLDSAYVPYGDLSNTHRFEVLFRLP